MLVFCCCLVFAFALPTAISLDALNNQDADAVASFVDSITDFGVVVLRPVEQKRRFLYDLADEALRYLRQTPSEIKQAHSIPVGGERDWGYVEVPNVKEFEQMRHGVDNNPLGQWSEDFYRMSMEMTTDVLAAVARHVMAVPEAKLTTDLLDAADAPLSSSIFRYFRYYELKNRSEACAVHTDIGLLTLIPVSNNPSLEEWVNLEASLQGGDVMALVGETLERATGNWLPACVHRVVPREAHERLSLVFLCRARPAALLDPDALRSPVLSEQRFKSASVAEFFREVYLSRSSANFVSKGQGLPAANLKGVEVREDHKSDAWREEREQETQSNREKESKEEL